TSLPDYYRVWLDLANNLTHLIESHTLRDLVHKMPVLSPDFLIDHRELRLAHLVLGFISMGYVWQEGQHAPAQVKPYTLALPYWLVSRRLGLPPILTYADSVLANWKLKDPTGDMEIGNMDLIVSFPGGESCRGFFMVSLLVEMAASSGITVSCYEMMNFPSASTFLLYFSLLLHCMFNWITCKIVLCASNCIYKTEVVCGLNCFRWRDNPMLPRGLLYEGVSNEPILLSGGSAAQSSTIQCFDALLCIQHEDETVDCSDRKCFQKQEYMPPAHRQLIETLSVCPSLRDFILSHSSSDLCQAYKSCVSALVDLRNYHLNTVAKYVVVPGNHARAMGCPLRGVGTALNETGTGGSSLMVFLKSVRNTTQKALILERPSASKETEM
uniref:Indoleamine 2,3-dioxygenase 1 n=1 Tax=Sander lucioperca TaxID=283035 RepID=A0A8D0A9X8_SANLU